MFPMSTQEIVRAEQSYRLEGFRRWSRRHAVGAPYSDPADSAGYAASAQVAGVAPAGGNRRHRSAVRLVLGR